MSAPPAAHAARTPPPPREGGAENAPLAARGPAGGALADVAGWGGPALLGVATALTAWSMVVYFLGVWPYMAGEQ